MGHVLLARPDQLDRRARQGLGDCHGLADVVVGNASTEATTDRELVDLALRLIEAGAVRHGIERASGVLCWCPDFAAGRPAIGRWRVERRRVHWLERRVVLERETVDRLDAPCGTLHRRGSIADAVAAHHAVLALQAALYQRLDGRAGQPRVRSFVPLQWQGVERDLGTPPGVGHHGDRRVADRHDRPDARPCLYRIGRHADESAASDRTLADRGTQQPRQPEVGAVDERAVDLAGGIEPCQRAADQRPVARRLEGHLLRQGQPGGGFGHLAIAQRATAGPVRDDAAGDGALRRRHPPGIGGGLQQHDPGGGTRLAQVIL